MKSPIFSNNYSSEELTKLKKGFVSHDKNGSGSIDQKEFLSLMKKNGMNLSEEIFEFMFSTTDSNQDGVIDFQEYLSLAYLGSFPQDQIFRARVVFNSFDKNNNGVIDKKELKVALFELGIEDLDDSDIQDIFSDFDTNYNQTLEFLEFFQLFQMLLVDQEEGEG